MAKEYKIISPSLSGNKYPSISNFEKMVESLNIDNKCRVRSSSTGPVLPEYLTEMKVTKNPFTVIKVENTKNLINLEKVRKDYDRSKVINYPTHQIVSRNIRNKFIAAHELRKLKNQIDMIEIHESKYEKKPEQPEPMRKDLIKHSNVNFINEERQICLLDLAINFKKENIAKLDKIVEKEQHSFKRKIEKLQKEKLEHETLLKQVCQQSSVALKLLDTEMRKKGKVNEKLKIAQFKKSHLNAECVKLEDEYLKLKTYQSFLTEAYQENAKKMTIERVSTLNQLHMDGVLQNMEHDTRLSVQDSDDSDQKRFSLFGLDKLKMGKNTNNAEEKGETKINEILERNVNNFRLAIEKQGRGVPLSLKNNLLDKKELNKLKDMIIMGFENVSNKYSFSDVINNRPSTLSKHEDLRDSEVLRSAMLSEFDSTSDEDILFDSPQDLVDIVCELEVSNLSLIENVQEQEEIIDNMLARIEKIRNDLQVRVTSIDSLIKREKYNIELLEDSIECIRETQIFFRKFDSVERYRCIFFFEDLDISTMDELLEYMTEEIGQMYHSIFESNGSLERNAVEMLREIEYLIDSNYVQIQSYDSARILKAKKLVDERRIEAYRLRQKELTKEAIRLKLQKTIEMAQQPPRYRFGRKIICRSEPEKRPKRINKQDMEKIRLKEENEFFFT